MEPVHPFGLAVIGEYIYWTDWIKRSVIRANKYTGGDVVILKNKLRQQPMGLVIVSEDVSDCKSFFVFLSLRRSITPGPHLSNCLALAHVCETRTSVVKPPTGHHARTYLPYIQYWQLCLSLSSTRYSYFNMSDSWMHIATVIGQYVMGGA